MRNEKNAKGCFGSDVVARSIRSHMTQLPAEMALGTALPKSVPVYKQSLVTAETLRKGGQLSRGDPVSICFYARAKKACVTSHCSWNTRPSMPRCVLPVTAA